MSWLARLFRRPLTHVAAMTVALASAAGAEEAGPYPTGVPTYAQVASKLLPPVASSGQVAALGQYVDVGTPFVGSFVRFPAGKPGDYLEQMVTAESSDELEVVVWAPRGPVCGTFSVSVDGQVVGEAVDAYAPQAQGPLPTELGEIALTKGEHRLRLEVTGKNAASRGYEIWVDSYLVRTKPEGAFVREWQVAGPFGGDGVTANAPPKGAFWRQVIAEGGLLDLVGWMGEVENVAAWAKATIESPDERQTLLWVGSDDGVAVWLNGKKVHEEVQSRPALKDQDRVPITLRQGTNHLQVRVNNLSGGWGLFVRPQDPKGELGLAGVVRETPPVDGEAPPAGMAGKPAGAGGDAKKE